MPEVKLVPTSTEPREMVALAREFVDRHAATVQIAQPAFRPFLVLAESIVLADGDAAASNEDWPICNVSLHRLIARTAAFCATREPLATFECMVVENGGIRVFTVDHCETCGCEIEAPNSLLYYPEERLRRIHGAEAIRGLALEFAGQGIALIQTRIDEGWYDEATGMERCQNCETYADKGEVVVSPAEARDAQERAAEAFAAEHGMGFMTRDES